MVDSHAKLDDTAKVKYASEKDLDQQQEMLRSSLSELTVRMPLGFAASMAKVQLLFHAHQTRRIGTTEGHNLNFESFNIVYNAWRTSKKNPGKSIISNYQRASTVRLYVPFISQTHARTLPPMPRAVVFGQRVRKGHGACGPST